MYRIPKIQATLQKVRLIYIFIYLHVMAVAKAMKLRDFSGPTG